MPNLWTKTTQSIYEFVYGPRTRDVEFDAKAEEVKVVLSQVMEISQIVASFPARTAGLLQFCQDIHSKFHLAYNPNIVYFPFIKEVCEAHKNVESAYLRCKETVSALTQMSSEWNKLHNEVKENLINREKAREIYDHYDEKMEKVVRSRNDKMSRHQNETPKDIEQFDRNDGKYKRAANDLIQLSNYTYKLIQDLLDYRYRMLNPLIAGLVAEEKKFFDACAEVFKKFDGITQKVVLLDKGYQGTPISYDPTKHIRASRLLVGLDVKTLPELTPKDKYSYEDYKQRTGLAKSNPQDSQMGGGMGGGMSTGMGMGSQMNPYQPNYPGSQGGNNMSKIDPKEHYAQVMGNSSQINPSNSFSYEAYKAKIQNIPEKKFDNVSQSQMNNQPNYQQSSFVNPYSNNSKPNTMMNTDNNNYAQEKLKSVPNPYAGIDFNTPSSQSYGNFNNNNNLYKSGFPNESMVNNPLNNNNNQPNYYNKNQSYNPGFANPNKSTKPSDFPY